MRLLIDLQSLIWYVDQDHLLSSAAHAAMTDPNNDLLLSAATIWEIAIKVGLKKLSLSMPYKEWITKAIADLGMTVLPISTITPLRS
jgi:PIN domain nuclease of toxin-antitoxin system